MTSPQKPRVLNLEYPEALVKIYSRLASLPGFVLLQSGDQHLGRYDILAAFPYDQLMVRGDSWQEIVVLKQRLKALKIAGFAEDLPFQTGAIGYVSYDFAAWEKGLKLRRQASLETMPLIHLGLYDWGLVVDHWQQQVWLVQGNQQAQTAAQVEEVLSLWRSCEDEAVSYTLAERFQPLISREAYQKSFNLIYQALYQGRCYQVNFTQAFTCGYTGSAWGIYQTIAEKNPVPFASYLNLGQGEVLSFSPERFLRLHNQTLSTSPIKGTIRRSNQSLEDQSLQARLLSSAKNRAENVMIVDLMRNDLGKLALPGSVAVKALCQLQSFKSVHHLVSEIEAKPHPDWDPIDIFFSCFPGGSITGAPKLEAMRVINEEEAYSRGVYCGSVVYFSAHGGFDSNIAIRTLVAHDNLLHLAAGGALVIDSDCEDEYCESYVKLEAILNALQG